MVNDDYNFQKDVQERLRLERLARRILGVPDNASLAEIKKAYWLLAMQHHPDKNPGDKEALRHFHNIRAAYDYLTKGEGGRDLSPGDESPFPGSASDQYDTTNTWGYFLWWRDKFFR